MLSPCCISTRAQPCQYPCHLNKFQDLEDKVLSRGNECYDNKLCEIWYVDSYDNRPLIVYRIIGLGVYLSVGVGVHLKVYFFVFLSDKHQKLYIQVP
jgi:hypothetical protein